MNPYQRFFGAGPAGFLISLLLLGVSGLLENRFSGFQIIANDLLRYSVFALLSLVAALMALWSVISLPLNERGTKLITVGAFKYFRHPLYGAFLSFFNFGLAFLLNNWIYIFWAVIQHPVWHWVIRGEEKLMQQLFPGDYEEYAQKTGRFFPRVWA